MYTEDERNKEYKKWQSIKLLEAILVKLRNELQNLDISKLMSPLYILHDYRIYFDHLLSIDKREDTKQHILNTLGVSNFESQEDIYITKRLKG